MNGYQIIQEIATRSNGVWKPSPGSIYPTLQQLEDEGLVRVETEGGRRAYTLTDEGRAYVTDHADEVSAPWQAMSEAGGDDDGIIERARIETCDRPGRVRCLADRGHRDPRPAGERSRRFGRVP